MSINIDYKSIIAREMKKQEENQMSNNSSGFKTFYPFNEGIVSLKFLPNEGLSSIYRTIYVHKCDVGGRSIQVPCLEQMYGVECPICNMVKRIQTDYDDKFVFGKYGYKTRGIMYAKIVGIEKPTYDEYFKGNNSAPELGETVIFMFPKACMNELSNLLTELGDESEFNYVFVNNTTRIINLRIGKGANGFPEYRFTPTMKMYTAYTNDAGDPDNEIYEKYIKELPSLEGIKFPATIDSPENSKSQQFFVKILEEMTRKYYPSNIFDAEKTSKNLGDILSGKKQTLNNDEDLNNYDNESSYQEPYINDDDIPFDVDEPKQNETTVSSNFTQSNETITNSSNVSNVGEVNQEVEDLPDCFNNNQYDEKCNACPFTDKCL